MTSSINPQNVSYLNREPYITTDEFLNSPIGSTVDTTNLIPGGTAGQQTAALQQLIYMASADADNICLGALGTLCASSNVEQGRVRVGRDGMIVVHPAYWPILEVDSFSVGSIPGSLTTIPVSSSNCWIEQRQFVMSGGAYSQTSQGPLDFGGFGGVGHRNYINYSYVNGFFNQFLSSSVSTGATSIVVPAVIGLYPGMPFTIWDAGNTETATVSSSWNGTSTTVTLTSALTHNHASGVNVSTLPASVKQAVIHLVVAAIKQRGEGGLVIAEVGAPSGVGSSTNTASSDLQRARDLLRAFIQVWGRT